MKNLIFIFFIHFVIENIYCQVPQEFKPPFAYGKYVHYDKEIRDVASSYPYVTYADNFNYRNNQSSYNNYAKINYYIKYGRKDCSSEHHN
jgi:hypothetical protein